MDQQSFPSNPKQKLDLNNTLHQICCGAGKHEGKVGKFPFRLKPSEKSEHLLCLGSIILLYVCPWFFQLNKTKGGVCVHVGVCLCGWCVSVVCVLQS